MTRSHVLRLAIAAITLTTGGLAHGFQERLIIPWGRGVGYIGHRLEPSGSYGPTDFTIIRDPDDTNRRILYLLDREQRMIQAFGLDDGVPVRTLGVPRLTDRFAVMGDSLALWDGSRLYMGLWGAAFLRGPSESYPFRTIEHLSWLNGEVTALDERGTRFALTKNGAFMSPERVEARDLGYPRAFTPGTRTLVIDWPGRPELRISLPFEIGGAEHLGICGDYHVIVADEVLGRSPIIARQVLILVPMSGDQPRTISVPRVYYSWFPRSFAMVDGVVYGFVSSPRGLHLFSADATDLADPGLGFPELPEEPYHFNDHLPTVPQAEHGRPDTRDEDPLSRSQMMANARVFVDLSWTATSSNITSGIEMMPDGSYVRTPTWVTIGSRQKVAYKWGGFTSTATYAAGVPAGKKCGDDYTESVSWTDLYCIGVDCSGFVSRCWDTDQKYGTATLSQIATQLGSFSEMLRGDCVNLVSSHVRLCAEDNPPGMVLTMEASAYDWRVSYRSYTLTALSSYVPMRFNWVIEEDGVAPFVVRVKDGVVGLNVRPGPSTSESVITTISSGQRYVATSHHNGWYHVHIPSGTGVHGGWSSGGTSSSNGYLEGSQSTPVVTVTVSALNVREGPGTGYAVITTIGEGQHFAVLSSSGGWHQIQLCNTPGYVDGWASAGYLSLTPGGPRDGYGASVESVTYPSEMDEDEIAWVTLGLTNTGQCSWDASTLLATTVPRGRTSILAHATWSDSTTVGSLGPPVLPYQSHSMTFQIQAPEVGADTAIDEHFGITQSGFCWFGDPGQRGPSDEAIALSIVVRNVGGLETPAIDPASVVISSGQLSFSWAPVSGASFYRVFRSNLGGPPAPEPVVQTLGLSFGSPYGVGDPAVNARYWVRAYAAADSSELSQAVGEQDFALP